MKQFYYLLVLAIIGNSLSLIAQEKNYSWSFEVGVNAVDVYPVGEPTPQGAYFDEFLNVNDHWNLGTYLSVTRDFTDHLSLTARGSLNQISKWGELGDIDPSVLVDNLKYYGLDGMVNYSFGKNKLKPFVSAGGGYTWIEEGPYNTFSTKEGVSNLVGAGTLNGALGAKCLVSSRFSINLQVMYKHSFKEYLTKHWQHSFGISYNFGKSESVKIDEKISDKDGDGVEDDHDLCPNIFGLKQFAGCPDTDGDGVPDSIDDCPTIKSNGRGCPIIDESKNKISENNTTSNENSKNKQPTSTSKTIYFNSGSTEIDNNAKQVLDVIISASQNANHYTISVAGYTDNIGSTESNNRLSFNRAKNVKNYLISKGVSADNITTSGYGETESVASNNSNYERSLNRRSVITLKIN